MDYREYVNGYYRYAFSEQEHGRKLAKLLAAGMTLTESNELFALGRKLMHHGIIECNRPRTDKEVAEQAMLIDEAAGLTRKFSGIVAVELGDPRGRVLKVALRTPDGTPINGDDFGDSRLLCL